MTSYRYLGSATTDANGIAKYNFTGSGAGEIDFIASLDNPITSSSIVSVPCNVLDCIYYDPVNSDTSSNYYLNTNVADISYDNSNLVITATTTQSSIYVEKRNLTDNVKGNTIYCSVDVIPTDCSARLDIYVDGTRYGSSTITTEGLLEKSVDIPSSATDVKFRIAIDNITTGSLAFKNWKVYPI